jgi:hypothetical protein
MAKSWFYFRCGLAPARHPGRQIAGQLHLDFKLSAGTALKGHGFSRAKTWCEKRTGFSRRGMLLGWQSIPQGRRHSSGGIYGTAEAMPFQIRSISQSDIRLSCARLADSVEKAGC